MEFGLQFFPAVAPSEKSAQQYWGEALQLVGLCDANHPLKLAGEIGMLDAISGGRLEVGSVAAYVDMVGEFEIASLQVNFHTIAVDDAERSMRLFAEEVMPHIKV